MNGSRNAPRVRGVLPLLAALALSSLSGCGGDDGSPAPTGGGTSLSITGTAASGAAVSGGSVEAVCASGTGTATSTSTGTYTITISGGTLPCVLRITATGGQVLHSVATGSGTSAVSDITPATELVVAQLAGQDPAAFYAAFSASAVTATTVSAAEAAVVALLHDAGIDFSTAGDLVSGTLVAGTTSGAGNAYDTALDALTAALANADTTLATLTSAVIAANGSSGDTTLPPGSLLQPAAANCSALRSGAYRLVTPTPGGTLDDQFDLVSIDASTLTLTRGDGTTANLAANGPCRFTESDPASGQSGDLVVTQAGVLLARYTSGDAVLDLIGFPEQTHTLADLQGNWNIVGMNRAGSADVAVTGAATLDAAGAWSAVSNCENDTTWAVDTCADVPSTVASLLAAWTVDANGGFDVPDAGTGAVNSRVFAYRSGGGATMLVTVSATGFGIWTPVQAFALPAAGSTTTSWNLDMNADLTSNTATYETINAVDTVDAAAGSWTRTHTTVGQSVSRVETVYANNPRSGYFFRPAATVTGSDGVTQVNIREFTLMSVVGMGMSAGPLPQLELFELSAREP